MDQVSRWARDVSRANAPPAPASGAPAGGLLGTPAQPSDRTRPVFVQKWANVDLPLISLEAAKKGTQIECPHPLLGSTTDDQVIFELPTFQRGLVWTDTHGRSFQEALREGWPIGDIVLAERTAVPIPGGVGSLRRFELIDGQQRTFWLNRTRDTFFRDCQYSLRTPEANVAILSLTATIGGVNEDGLRAAIQAWTAKSEFSTRWLRDSNQLFHHLTAFLGTPPPSAGSQAEASCQDAIVDICREIETQYAALVNMKIPALLIREQLSESLHDIFQRLNSSTTLSDLDLLAAEWSRIHAPIKESSTLKGSQANTMAEIAKNRILETYDSEAYEYSPEAAELSDDQLSLFDLLYSLGRFAQNSYPATFEALESNSDRLAIFVAALLFGGGIGRRKEVAHTYPDEVASAYRDVSNFPAFFLRACADLDAAFARLNAVRAGRRLRGRLGLVQAATYIASHMAVVYQVDAGVKRRMNIRQRSGNDELRLAGDSATTSVAARRDRFKRNVVAWFLRDVLAEDFQGSDAYSNAAKRVWSEFDADNRRWQPSEAMLHSPSADEILALCADRFRKEMDVTATPKRRRYSEAACAILRVAYAGTTLTIAEEEIDHVVPFDARNGRTFAVAINHGANLMPIPKRLNGGRRDAFLPTFVERLGDEDVLAVTERLITPLADAGASSLADPAAFRSFLLGRWSALVKAILSLLRLPGASTSQEIDSLVEVAIVDSLTDSEPG